MKDGLAGFAVGVEDGPETAVGVAAFARDGGGAARHLPDERVVLGAEIVQWIPGSAA